MFEFRKYAIYTAEGPLHDKNAIRIYERPQDPAFHYM